MRRGIVQRGGQSCEQALRQQRALRPVQVAHRLVGVQGSWEALSLDQLPVSSPGLGPGAAAAGHAGGARQWAAGGAAAHQEEPGEQTLVAGGGSGTFASE